MKKINFIIAFVCMIFIANFSVSASDFLDGDKISNKIAVDSLGKFSVIKGYTDHTFRPKQTITRAEIIKMIYVILEKHDDNAIYYIDDDTKLIDIKSHWAEGYIKYGVSKGLISGDNNNKFNPESPITGDEIAKILLGIIGYDEVKSNFIGDDWQKNVNILAKEHKLLTNYDRALSQKSSRELSSQMLFNSLFSSLIYYRDDVPQITQHFGRDYILGEKYLSMKFDSKSAIVTNYSSEYGIMMDTKWYRLSPNISTPKVSDTVKCLIVDDFIYDLKIIQSSPVALTSNVSLDVDSNGFYSVSLLMPNGETQYVKTKRQTKSGLIVYYVQKDTDIYELREITNANPYDFDSYIVDHGGYNYKLKSLGDFIIRDDAFIFVRYMDNGKYVYDCINGYTLKKSARDLGDFFKIITKNNKMRFAYLEI